MLTSNPFYWKEKTISDEIIRKGIQAYLEDKYKIKKGETPNTESETLTQIITKCFPKSTAEEWTKKIEKYKETVKKIQEISFIQKKEKLRNVQETEIEEQYKDKNFIELFKEMYEKEELKDPEQEQEKEEEKKKEARNLIKRYKQSINKTLKRKKNQNNETIDKEPKKITNMEEARKEIEKQIKLFISGNTKKERKNSFRKEHNSVSLLPKRMEVKSKTYPAIAIDSSGSMSEYSNMCCSLIYEILKKKKLLGKVKTYKMSDEMEEFDINKRYQWPKGDAGCEEINCKIINKNKAILFIGDGYWSSMSRIINDVKIEKDIIFIGKETVPGNIRKNNGEPGQHHELVWLDYYKKINKKMKEIVI